MRNLPLPSSLPKGIFWIYIENDGIIMNWGKMSEKLCHFYTSGFKLFYRPPNFIFLLSNQFFFQYLFLKGVFLSCMKNKIIYKMRCLSCAQKIRLTEYSKNFKRKVKFNFYIKQKEKKSPSYTKWKSERKFIEDIYFF